MKKNGLIILMMFFLVGCDSDDENDMPSNLAGRVYSLVSFSLDSGVDLNGDNIFSNNLKDEGYNCFLNNLRYMEDNKVQQLDVISINLSVESDSMGNLIQEAICMEPDGALHDYKLFENTIEHSHFGDLEFVGVATNNYTVLTFTAPYESFLGLRNGNEILNPDGTVLNYTGNVTVVYELVE